MTKNKTIWVKNADGLFFTNVGLCLSEEAWYRSMKEFKIKSEPYPISQGRCTYFESTDNNPKSIIVVLNVDEDDLNELEKVSLLVHEVVHVVQFIFEESWREEKPSSELQAYATQYFFQQLYEAWIKSR